MENSIKQAMLAEFVRPISSQSVDIQPINIDINTVSVETNMTSHRIMKTRDEKYVIKYGGFSRDTYYNAIEVYSVDSLDNNTAEFIFSNFLIEGHIVYITSLKQSSDGRFYGRGQYYDGSNFTYYLIIFNNFIQDGVLKINKFYKASSLNLPAGVSTTFANLSKQDDTGLYVFTGTKSSGTVLIKLEINVLEGNKIETTDIIESGTITSGSVQTQLNIFGNSICYTELWEDDNYKLEYKKAVLNTEEQFPEQVTISVINTTNATSTSYVSGATNKPYEVVIPLLSSYNNIYFRRIDINGTITVIGNFDRTFPINSTLSAYIEGDYAIVKDTTDNTITLFYFGEGLANLEEFYHGSFSSGINGLVLLKQYNLATLITESMSGSTQTLIEIKNIYSPGVTSIPYYNTSFVEPYYLNLYSNSLQDDSLFFSRDASSRFVNGNQVTSTFIVPNYLLNDGNINRADLYGITNNLLTKKIQNFPKNKFESLYLNFIYNLNVIDNTNGLNMFNQNGSNRVASLFWEKFDDTQARLKKVRITYEDLSTEIITLNLPTSSGTSATYNYTVTGNVIKIEYLSNDDNTVYATFRTNLTGTNTITQTVRIQ